MATDQATPASDIKKSGQSADDAGDETVQMSRVGSGDDEPTVQMQRPPAAPKAAPAKKPKSVLEKVRPPRRSLKEYLRSTDGRIALLVYFISTIVHGLVLVVLALMLIDPNTMDDLLSIISDKPEENLEVEDVFQALEQPEQIHNQAFEDNPQDKVATDLVEETMPLDLDVNDLEPSIPIDPNDFSAFTELAKQGDLAGRTSKGRKALVEQEGGSEASEAAVIRALKWLASVQQPDGSWSFAEIGESKDAGSLEKCQMGATGMALMAFLGAGHTHMKDGPYKKNVEAGLGYLLLNGKLGPTGVDFRAPSNEGNMYTHGIVSIALAEAYGMTKDQRLRRAAEGGLAFIINAQGKDGGWRYAPQQDGDTSVVGWQVMALISGHHSGISVPKNVFTGATKFLDKVQAEEGAHYGYDAPAPNRPGTTAVGLLCRMYLGWNHETDALKRGVLYLGKVGPSNANAYYNYYATQVMHHIGGEAWEKWNVKMREHLIATQHMEGPEKGSWKAVGAHSEVGGRLYETCLNVMILEVYYRHLPLYQRNAVQADF